MTVLCIGKTRYDITCLVENFNLGNKVMLNEGIRCGGGPASNTAFLLGKWGVESIIASTVGADDFAEKIKKEFSDINVNTNYLETNYEQGTSINLVLLNNTDKNTVSYETSFAYKPLKKYNYDFTPDIVFMDSYDYGASQNAISKYKNAISILDARVVNNETLELAKYAKYIIASNEFAQSVTGNAIDFNSPDTLVNLYSKLISKYPNADIIVTLGKNGALYKANNQIKIMPALNVEVKDISGAKDAFNGCFIYGLINGYDIERNITLSNIAAGLTCKEVGGRCTLPSITQVMDEYSKKFGTTQTPAENTNNQTVQPEVNQIENQNNEVQNSNVEQPVVEPENNQNIEINVETPPVQQ